MIIDNNIGTLLRNTIEIEEGRVRIRDRLDRPTYKKVNDVLEAMGGKWSRRDKAHIFLAGEEDIRLLIETVTATGYIETLRESQQRLGFFVTPPETAKRLVRVADVREGMTALEPSAGEGAIVRALLDAGATVWSCEIDDKRRMKLVQMRTELFGTDFMRMHAGPARRFDRIVMNPPFGRHVESDHIDHVLHAIDFLDSDGVLVSVVPASAKYREDKRHEAFRARCKQRFCIVDFVDMPEHSFAESGTHVHTVALVGKGVRAA